MKKFRVVVVFLVIVSPLGLLTPVVDSQEKSPKETLSPELYNQIKGGQNLLIDFIAELHKRDNDLSVKLDNLVIDHHALTEHQASIEKTLQNLDTNGSRSEFELKARVDNLEKVVGDPNQISVPVSIAILQQQLNGLIDRERERAALEKWITGSLISMAVTSVGFVLKKGIVAIQLRKHRKLTI